jgi:hypothetical protein
MGVEIGEVVSGMVRGMALGMLMLMGMRGRYGRRALNKWAGLG